MSAQESLLWQLKQVHKYALLSGVQAETTFYSPSQFYTPASWAPVLRLHNLLGKSPKLPVPFGYLMFLYLHTIFM